MSNDREAREANILMCPPDYFGIEYEINPWMSRARPAVRETAIEQWNGLHTILKGFGAQISLMEPRDGLPDLVFTANAAIMFKGRAILSNFKHPQRQEETPVDAEWFVGHGFEIEYLPEEVAFEGAGDALFCGDTLFAGYRIRSDAGAQQKVGESIGCRVIPLVLVSDYYYHLDTCFCPISPTQAIYFPGAFDEYGLAALKEHVPELIEVAEEEAKHFACNAVVVGKSIVTNVGCPKLHQSLKERGFETAETPLHEFVKSGGSAKCLTLRLDGEDAATWAMA